MRLIAPILVILFVIPYGGTFKEDISIIDEISDTKSDDLTYEDTFNFDYSDPSIKGDFFTQNLGQKSEGAGSYYVLGNPLSAGFNQGRVSYNLKNQDNTSNVGGVLFRTNFIDCNPVEPVGIQPLPHKNNFFIGNDPDKWVTGAGNYQEIWYRDLWDRIDLRYYFKGGMLKYDFIVHPGANPERIQIEYEGIESLTIESNNDLRIQTIIGSVTDQAPFAFQEDRDVKNIVDCSFNCISYTSLQFQIGDYNNNRSMIIDPGLIFSTYIGGSQDEGSEDWRQGQPIAVDNQGNTYITGYTELIDFPVTSGAYNTSGPSGYDGIVSKLNTSGRSLDYSTFFGSIANNEWINSIQVDEYGNVIATGDCGGGAVDFPITPGVFQSSLSGGRDGFLFKLNETGSGLIFSSFLGGSNSDYPIDLCIGKDNSIYIVGITSSTDFSGVSNGYDSTLNGNQDAFILHVNQDATKILNGTLFGGSYSNANKRVFTICLDNLDNVIIGGHTWSNDLPTTSSSYQTNLKGPGDGYIAKFDPTLRSLICSTYIGGSFNGGAEDGAVTCIKVDAMNNIYACGWTKSSDFPTSSNGYDKTLSGDSDFYVVKLDKDLNNLLYGSYIGGSDIEIMYMCGFDITLDDDVVIVGTTQSRDIPITEDCLDSTYNDRDDAFILRLSLKDGLKYGSYFGGSSKEWAFQTLHLGPVYTTIGGLTSSNDFPTTTGAFDTSYNGEDDFFIARLFTGFNGIPPSKIFNLSIFSDLNCTNPIQVVNISDEIYIEIIGMDSSPLSRDIALVTVTTSISDPTGFPLTLWETGLNTGVYRNSLNISDWTNPVTQSIKTLKIDTISIISINDPSFYSLLKVFSPVLIYPFEELLIIEEDVIYNMNYSNMGFNPVSDWKIETDADWLKWDINTLSLRGQPDNGDIGSWWVRIRATDGMGNFDERNITIEVINTPPRILNENKITGYEGELFSVDYECDDEGQGDTQWDMEQYIDWLDFNENTGILSGIPKNDDVGIYDINISVDDGNGGKNWTTFTLTVIDINDPPEIQTEPSTSIEQGKNYYVQFNAYDRDDINTFEWIIKTDAGFLEIDNRSGTVSGIPGNDNVGSFFINVSATDLRGLSGWINYTLEVIDVNDAPSWSIKPQDIQVDEGDEYSFSAEAIDVDVGDSVSYSVSSIPSSDISIDEISGEILWIGTTEGLTPNPNYVLNVEISGTDGKETITHGFTITVIPNPSPTSIILSPDDGKRITSEGVLLEWEGEDDGIEPLRYYIYLGDSYTSVSMLERNSLWMVEVVDTSYHTGEVERGKTYYWTVIPRDMFSYGICTNDVFSFSVNIPPSIQDFTIPEAKIGDEFRLNLIGSDLNGDDLEFNLEEGSAGMEIFDGMITWIPAESQVGTHIVNVSLSDGYETVYKEFEVTVVEKEVIDEPDDKGSPIVLIIIIILVVLILAGAGVGLFLYMKKKGEKEPTEKIPPEDTGPPEEEKQAYNQLYGPT